MLFFFYDLLLLMSLFFIRKKGHHFQRIFGKVPEPKKEKRIWIHAVSLGEVKAFYSLFVLLKKKNPDAFFLITSVTKTGFSEAKKLYGKEASISYLPMDLSFIMRRWVKKIDPSLFMMIEGDLWPNLLRCLKKRGAKIALISAKISEKSYKRALFFSFLSKKHLFSRIDCVCAQSEEHYLRFEKFIPKEKLFLTGNLKWDQERVNLDPLPASLFDKPLLTIASTHTNEEDLILNALPLDRFFIVLAPRHPERFDEVATLLERKKISFVRWSQWDQKKTKADLLLLDTMGKLPLFYEISKVSLVGGSFVKEVGGHNLFEPLLYGSYVLFGPYVFAQQQMAQAIDAFGVGKKVSLELLSQEVEMSIEKFDFLQKKMEFFTRSVRGEKEKVLAILEKI